MNIAVEVEPPVGQPGEVRYTWDPDTDILSARVLAESGGIGMSGSVEVEGSDGSWLILDVDAGRINGVEVAVWPDIQTLADLAPPDAVEDARVMLPQRRSQPGIAALEADMPIVAEADGTERVIRFRLGEPRATRVVRLARDLLLEVDQHSQIAGLWLLNVPPYPDEA